MQTAAEAITSALDDKDWLVREIAADTAGKMPESGKTEGKLRVALSDEFWQVRLKAVRSLGKLGSTAAIDQIAECLAHEQANLRKEAASALGEIGDPRAIPLLKDAIDDPDPEVRKNARWAHKLLSERVAASH
jgi:HEAT repeat protein